MGRKKRPVGQQRGIGRVIDSEQLRLRRSQQFFERSVEMLHGFSYGQRIHFLAGVLAGFDGGLKVVSRDLDSERIGDDLPGAGVVFLPGAVRQSDRDRLAICEELDIYCVGVARRDGYDEALVDAVNVGLGPVVLRVEVIKHGKGSIAFAVSPQQTPSHAEEWSSPR